MPDLLIACVGGGSNAIGLFWPFLNDAGVKMFGVEAAGHGLTQWHAARLQAAGSACCTATSTYLLLDDDGQIQAPIRSPPVSTTRHRAGTRLPARPGASTTFATDDEALDAFQLLARLEGIIPALESAHAIAQVMDLAPRSGRKII